jgi:hypothetical protein
MSKEITITPELFDFKSKKNKTLKQPKTAKKLKKELLERLSQGELITELDNLTETNLIETPEIKSESTTVPYGCLKNGTKPTLQQLKTKTIKQYSSFGKKNNTVRVLIKDKTTYDAIAKDIEKIKKHPMNKIRNFLKTKRLYKVGSTAPDDVLREIYVNVHLTGDIENKNLTTMVHNYMNNIN